MITRFLSVFGYFGKLLYLKGLKKSQVEQDDFICQAVSDLGGVYVKLLQFLTFQPNIFSNTQKIKFLTFYDQVPEEEMNICETLEKELSKEQRASIESVDTRAFAGGSFGQVYRAKLKDGRDVVLKVKRKNLLKKVNFDLALVSFLSFFFKLFYPQKLVDIDGVISTFRKVTKQELDYKKEVENAVFFYNLYKDHKTVFIPKTYADLCSKNVIVQEYVEGVSLTELLALRARGGDPYSFVSTNYNTDLRAVLPDISFNIWVESYVQDRFYADTHLGNIKILKNNRYALVDFGIVAHMTGDRSSHLSLMSHLASPWREWDPKLLARQMLVFASKNFLTHVENVEGHFNLNQNGKFSELIIDEYAKKVEVIKQKFGKIEDDGKNNYMGMMTDMFAAGEVFGTKVRGELFGGIRNSSIFKSWVEFLDPEFHFSKYNMDRTCQFLKDNRFEPVEKGQPTIEESLEEILNWFSSLAENNRQQFLKFQLALGGGLNV